MKHSLPLALLLGLIVSCGRTSDMEGDDGVEGSGGNGNGATSSGGMGDATTGGTVLTGGSSSDGATGGTATHPTGGSPSDGGNGGVATGGETALGGMGGEGGLPWCDQPGYPVPTVTQKLMLTGSYWEGIDVGGEHSYEGVVVTGPVDETKVTFMGLQPDASFQVEAASTRPGQVVEPPLLRQLFTEGEEIHITFQVTDYFPLFAQLRRIDGSLVAFIHTGVFQPELIASLDLPIPWSLEPWCRYDGLSSNASEALALHTQVGAETIELSAYQERELEVGGSPFLLTVYFAAELGDCSGPSCTLIDRPVGPNLDAQLISLD